MAYYVSARLFWAVTIVIGIVAVNFVLTRIIPGNPVNALVGDFPVPQEYIDQIRRELGLDRAMFVQLGLYLMQLSQGNLGFSFVNRQPVLPLLLDRAGVTLMLMIPSLIIASVLGVAIAVRAARSGGSTFNTFLTGLSLVGVSVPVFWLAQLLIMQFSVNLGWLPAQGMSSVRISYTGFAWFLDYLRHLALPAFCITLSYMAVVVRVARTSMLEMLDQDFVLTARAKGLSETDVLRAHVLRNSLIPVITVIGYNFGYSLTGAILTETVFAWPGLAGCS
jgi:peptide/nickel transport system permease protein